MRRPPGYLHEFLAPAAEQLPHAVGLNPLVAVTLRYRAPATMLVCLRAESGLTGTEYPPRRIPAAACVRS